jgi:hypothetical protein
VSCQYLKALSLEEQRASVLATYKGLLSGLGKSLRTVALTSMSASAVYSGNVVSTAMSGDAGYVAVLGC